MSEQIVVLGASRGIGKALVELLASDPKHTVWALARNLERMEQQFGHLSNVRCRALDLNRSDVREQCQALFAEAGNVTVLINNAGALVNKAFTDLSYEDIHFCYQVNIMGIMLATQAAVESMTEGHIVNISSMGGFQGSVKFPGLAAYSTSKAALCSFTELFAEEYKESGIRMNCLCLGAVQTEMLEEAFPGYQAPVTPAHMATYIADFALNAHKWMNGKIIPVSLSTP